MLNINCQKRSSKAISFIVLQVPISALSSGRHLFSVAIFLICSKYYNDLEKLIIAFTDSRDASRKYLGGLRYQNTLLQ